MRTKFSDSTATLSAIFVAASSETLRLKNAFAEGRMAKWCPGVLSDSGTAPATQGSAPSLLFFLLFGIAAFIAKSNIFAVSFQSALSGAAIARGAGVRKVSSQAHPSLPSRPQHSHTVRPSRALREGVGSGHVRVAAVPRVDTHTPPMATGLE